MNIHEYQAREIFASYGIPVPRGEVTDAPAGAQTIAERFAAGVVVKAQVHAGGRGKAGGIKLAATPAGAYAAAQQILGMEIKGLTVQKVLVTEQINIASESYVGIIIDRAEKKPLFMVSSEGGIDIEEVAKATPGKIHRMHVNPLLGLHPYQARTLAYKLYPDTDQANQTAKILTQLYRAFIKSDASLAEINPLVTTPQGKVWALDAKVNIDDNGLYRQPEIAALRDIAAEVETEVKAREQDLSYVKLDGEIGCVVNGAGLAMATMDMVKYYGSEPANFLDVGGSSSPDKVVAAMEIVTSDPNVKAILVNIFGGITRCDDVASGIVTALQQLKRAGKPVQVPIVIRLTGTNEEEGRRILEGVGLAASSAMAEAVQKAIALSRS